MSHSLTKHLKQLNATLSDLDGLLVNSENFNQLLIQRIDPEWMTATISRVLKSDAHLKRLTQILISCIVGEHHPDRVYHALVWFTQLINSPARQRFATDPVLRDACRPLISYANEMLNMTDLYDRCVVRAVAIQQWAKGLQSHSGIPRNLYYGGLFDVPSTGYVYLDDSDEDFGQRSARPQAKRLTRSGPTSSSQGPSSAECVDSLSELDDLDLVDTEGEEEFASSVDGNDSDDGVFDVNETASSDDVHGVENPPSSPRGPRSTEQHHLTRDDNFLEQTDGLDEPSIGTDEVSSDSDEELDLLMWTGNKSDQSSTTDSGNELSDHQQTGPALKRTRTSPRSKPCAKSPESSQPRRSTRQKPLRDRESKTPTSSSKPKRSRLK